MFEVWKGIDEGEDLLLRQDKGKCGRVAHSGHFKLTPPLLEDEESEETDQGGMGIDGVVGKFLDPLQVEKIVTDVFVGDFFRRNRKGFGNPREIGSEEGTVGSPRVLSEIAQFKIIFQFLEIGPDVRIWHKNISFQDRWQSNRTPVPLEEVE